MRAGPAYVGRQRPLCGRLRMAPTAAPRKLVGRQKHRKSALDKALDGVLDPSRIGAWGETPQLDVRAVLASGIDKLLVAVSEAELIEQLKLLPGPDVLSAPLQLAQWNTLVAEVAGIFGDMAMKRALLQEVLEVQESKFGPDSLPMAWTLKGLAQAHGSLGDQQQKWFCLFRALDIQENLLGEEHEESGKTRFFMRQVEDAMWVEKHPQHLEPRYETLFCKRSLPEHEKAIEVRDEPRLCPTVKQPLIRIN
eukprot:gnl/TRDRNA2_/TRDRNA2_36221_c0_seq1.p1 gnl/TRDRNA2_/TRDRNA2_36221_c0~~gnl/TRDRNA2_/TRDRNA2_36221_c0_seq1.p1  ORF type:complete len:251 (+),score=53.43 gnl/TRDRNA2_/TRDRNA2_36221_c0_seq1:60-812(+)